MQATRGTSLSSTDPAESSSSPASRYRLLFALVAVAAYAVDLGTKLLAVAHLTPHERVDVISAFDVRSLPTRGGYSRRAVAAASPTVTAKPELATAEGKE
jgi:signal peptidase II